MPGEITALGPSKSAAEAEAHLDAGFLPALILAAPARESGDGDSEGLCRNGIIVSGTPTNWRSKNVGVVYEQH